MVQEAAVEQLAAGRAFVDLSAWRKVAVGGAEARPWLDALASADLEDLAPGGAERALFLSPTGRIRAEFTVTAADGGLLMIQDSLQPRSVQDLLSPYVLSAEVRLEDRTTDLGLFAFPGLSQPRSIPGTNESAPSCVGHGVDVAFPARDRERVLESLSGSFTAAGEKDLDAWRVVAGVARLGVDGLEDDLPQEAGLTGAVSFGKGCFPGQEALAKVRNLGHPRRLLLQLEATGALAPGDEVHVDGTQAGLVTSVAPSAGASVALARIRWDVREGPFTTASGSELRLRRILA
jgi:folate-binding protein YgfZ